MVPFLERVYFANGGRPMVYDGSTVRNAGIDPPTQAPQVDSIGTGGSIDAGDYFFTYRWANSSAGIYSNFAPFWKETFLANAKFQKITNLQEPNDPQVDTLEIFCTREGGGATIYRLATIESSRSFTYSGSHTFSSYITALDATTTSDTVAYSIATNASTGSVNQYFRHGRPPATNVMALHGTRMLYSSTGEPGRVYFSRVDGGIQPEHVDVTPGLSGSIDIKTDAGDSITAMVRGDDDVLVYMRDGRFAITESGIAPTQTGGLEVPFYIQARDLDLGTVSPNSVTIVQDVHVFLSETDIFARSLREARNLSSVPEDITNPARPKIGRTVRSLNGEYLNQAVAMHRQSRQQAWFSVTRGSESRNHMILVYSYRDRKWMHHTISADYLIEVEGEGDRRLAYGFVNGYLCKLDETGQTLDDFSSGFSGVTDTIASQSSTDARHYNLTTGGLTAHAQRFREAWVGSSGKFRKFLILDNAAGSVRLLAVDNGATVTTGDTIYIGSIMPRLDLVMQPNDSLTPSKYRYIQIAPAVGGMTDFELNMWVDRFERDPDESNAIIAARNLTGNATDPFYFTDILSVGRFALIQILAPKPGKLVNIAEFAYEIETMRGVRIDV